MTAQTKHKALPLILLALSFLLTAMDWPVSSGKLLSNFGMNAGGLPQLGDTVAAEGDVYSADPGEVLFFSDIHDNENFISPLGNWVAVDHGDSLISVYGRLGEISDTLPRQLDKGVTLAQAGKSGWAARNGFYFSFFDRKERQWVNPIVILNPLADTISPVIQSVKLKNAAGQFYDLAQTRTIKQGRWTIIVQSSDRSEITGTPVAPFRIVSLLNGIEIGRLETETFSARDGSLLIYRNGLIPVRQVYENTPAVEAAGDVAFTRGQASLDITVQDFAGNARNASYRLFVE